jgi:hypothetical protein
MFFGAPLWVEGADVVTMNIPHSWVFYVSVLYYILRLTDHYVVEQDS